MSNRAKDYEDFAKILEDADILSSSTKEMDFVADMKAKYRQYGGNMFVSDKQFNYLYSIANWF